jgi:hypothetical protein
MIRDEDKYREASTEIEEQRIRLLAYRSRLTEIGLSAEEIERVTDPIEPLHLQLQEEVEISSRSRQ